MAMNHSNTTIAPLLCRAFVGAFCVAGVLIPTGVLAAEPATNDAEQRQKILEMVQGVKLEPEPVMCTRKPLCQQFLADFMQQKNIEYVQPIIQTDDYDDSRLEPFKHLCPKLVLNKHLEYSPRFDLDALFKLPEEEQEHYATYISYGTRNFKLYKLDLDNHVKPGVVYVFYDQDNRSVRPKEDEGKVLNPGVGEYAVVDFDACKFRRGGATGGMHFGRDTTADYHGIIKYQGKYYFVEFATSKPSLAVLIITGFIKSKTDEIQTSTEFYYSNPKPSSH